MTATRNLALGGAIVLALASAAFAQTAPTNGAAPATLPGATPTPGTSPAGTTFTPGTAPGTSQSTMPGPGATTPQSGVIGPQNRNVYGLPTSAGGNPGPAGCIPNANMSEPLATLPPGATGCPPYGMQTSPSPVTSGPGSQP